jgi:tetrapyrrole methylase family protein/MazG family protein
MKEFDSLVNTVRRLRSPGGCPWDRAQKVKNMENYLLEETYELIDAIDKKDLKSVKEELGDIFLILTVIAEMFRQKGNFNLQEVLRSINNKLIFRHPHVFGSKKLNNKEEVLKHWVNNKAKQKKRHSIKDRLAQAAPALLLADIFFKELSYLRGDKFKKESRQKLYAELKAKVRTLEKSNDSEKLLSGIVIDLANIAHRRGINLETHTRRAILKQAEKSNYRSYK